MLSFGIVSGYGITSLVSGDYPGDKIEKSLRFLIKDNYIHIHHWFYCLLLLVILIFMDIYHPLLYGIVLGAVIQGLTYEDCFVFFYHKNDFEKIYSKWSRN